MQIPIPGPEEILQLSDPAARLTAFLVIDSTRLGPAHGGVRVRAYDSERAALLDALDLAAAMTLKAALAGLPCGGGKIVVMDRPGLRRARAMRVIGEALNSLRGRYFAGPDYGITPADLAALGRASRHVAIDRPGASALLADATARGAVAAARAALAHAAGKGGPRRGARPARIARQAGEPLRGASALVQGLGAVGSAITRRLIAAGATVTACDPDPAAARRGAGLGARIVPPGRIGSLAADLFVPAAVGGTVDERFAARCRVRVVCGPANNALSSPCVEGLLRRRNIVFVPDVLASSGALIAGLSPRLRGPRDPGPAADRIGARVGRILREAEESGLDASEVARRVAARRLRRGR